MQITALKAGLIGSVLAVATVGALAAVGPTRAQDKAGRPHINVAPLILAEPAVETPLPIQVGPLEALPRNSFVRLRGLPPSTSLSEGHVISPGAWAIPLSALTSLKITAPIGSASKVQVSIAVVSVEGTVLAETNAALVVTAAAQIAPGDPRPAVPNQTSVAALGASRSTSSTPAASPVERAQPLPLATPPVGGPGVRSEERERALKLIGRGDQQMGEGDVAGARLFYERAADAGLPQAAIALAETYDPNELGRWRVQGMQPDRESARRWYERARELGAAEAIDRLRRLGAR